MLVQFESDMFSCIFRCLLLLFVDEFMYDLFKRLEALPFVGHSWIYLINHTSDDLKVDSTQAMSGVREELVREFPATSD